MHNLISRRFIRFALLASTALALTAAPYQLNLHAVAKIGPAAAYAKGEGGGGGGEGHGGSSGSGGNSGPGGGGDDGGNSGSSGHDNGAGDNHDANDDGHEHVNPTTGDKVEVDGNKVEVTHPDGTKEEVENGKFEMKDATGRTIVERPATPADIARLQGA
jgi:hypothetical protein